MDQGSPVNTSTPSVNTTTPSNTASKPSTPVNKTSTTRIDSTPQATEQVDSQTQQPDQQSKPAEPGHPDDIWEKVKAVKHKVKINGQDSEVDYDELLRGYQIRRASDEAFRQAKQQKAQAEHIFNLLQNEDEAFTFLEKVYGKDKMLARHEKELAKYLEFEQMPPEKKEILMEKEKFNKEKSEFENKQKEQQRLQHEAQTKYWQQQYDTQITQELAKANFPKNPRLVAEIARIMRDGIDYGMDISVIEAIKMWKNDQMLRSQELFNQFKPDQIFNTLPKEVVENIKKHIRESDLNSLKNPQTVQVEDVRKVEMQTPKQKKKVNIDDYFRNLHKNL